MNEYNISATSFGEGLYCLVFYLLVVLWFANSNLILINRFKHQITYPIKSKILIFCIALYSITDYEDMDFYYYYLYLKDLYRYNISTVENIYTKIAYLSNYDYYIFRTIIWGYASVFLYYTVKLNKFNLEHTLYTFFVLFIGTFAFARASLGLAILYFGYCLYHQGKKNMRLIGIFCIISSLLFHRTMILPALVALLPELKWNKKKIILTLVFIPFIVSIINIFIKDYLELIVFSDTATSNKVDFYLNNQNQLSQLSFVGLCQYVMEYSIFYFPMIFSVWGLYFKNKSEIGNCKVEIDLFQISFILLVISIAFEFIDLSTTVLAYRIRYMTAIPLCILFSSLVDKKIIGFKPYVIVMMIGIIQFSMTILSVIRHA